MKKIFTLSLALFCAMATFAQSDDEDTKGMYEFIDEKGNIVPDGSVITRNVVTESNVGDPQIETGLYVKKVTEEDYGVSLDINLTRLDNGSLQYCFPGSCRNVYSTGLYIMDYGDEMGNNSLQTEWLMDDYGEAEATFTLNACEQQEVQSGLIKLTKYVPIGECSSVTVHFVYADPTGISDINANNTAKAVAYYSADGKRLSAMQKGLNIVKLSDGKTLKVVK